MSETADCEYFQCPGVNYSDVGNISVYTRDRESKSKQNLNFVYVSFIFHYLTTRNMQ